MITVGQTLQNQIKNFNRVKEKINKVPGNKGETLKTKLAYVFSTNSGLKFLEQILKMKNGKSMDNPEINNRAQND